MTESEPPVLPPPYTSIAPTDTDKVPAPSPQPHSTQPATASSGPPQTGAVNVVYKPLEEERHITTVNEQDSIMYHVLLNLCPSIVGEPLYYVRN